MRDISSFIINGFLGDLKLNEIFNLKNHKNWLKTIESYPNNISKNYKGKYQGVILNVGVFENLKIKYLTIYVNDQKEDTKLVYKDREIELKHVTLNDIVDFLNFNHLEWYFKEVWEKVLILYIVQSGVELVFSYYEDEDNINLCLFQTILEEKELKEV